MTRAALLARYPQASESFLRANADPETVDGLPTPVPQRSVQGNALVEDEGKEKGPSRHRLRVTITSHRVRRLDPDNVFVKHIIDALRYKQLIPDDSLEHIILEVRQERVASKLEQGTLVEIWHT